MVKLKKVINKVEVGMILGLYNKENFSYLSGVVKKMVLQHDQETHEEEYHLEIQVDDFIKEITDIGRYEVVVLIDQYGRNLTGVDINEMRGFYFPDAYTDPVEVFCDMVEGWNYCNENEKEAMVTVLMERMNHKVMQQIMEKMSSKRNALAVTLGLEDESIFDQDEEDEEQEDEE